MKKSKLGLDFKKTKTKERIKLNKGQIQKMKLTIKFNKEEAEAWKSFVSAVKPEQLSEDDFIKSVFYNGANVIRQMYEQKAQEFFAAHPELLTSGIDLSPSSLPLEIVQN